MKLTEYTKGGEQSKISIDRWIWTNIFSLVSAIHFFFVHIDFYTWNETGGVLCLLNPFLFWIINYSVDRIILWRYTLEIVVLLKMLKLLLRNFSTFFIILCCSNFNLVFYNGHSSSPRWRVNWFNFVTKIKVTRSWIDVEV